MRYTTVISFLFLGTLIFSQESIEKKVKIKEDKFFITSYGLIYSSYRDLATSPLFYNGPGLHFSLGTQNETKKKEETFSSEINISSNTAILPEAKNFQKQTSAFYLNIPIKYCYLRKNENWKFKNYNIILGGTFLNNVNSRINPSLFNNSAGFDVLSSLMFSSMLSRTFIRENEKQLNFLFFNKKLPPKSRSLQFLLNLGIVNLNYRPDYAYINEAEINGTKTNWVKYALDGYKIAWNGFNINSEVALTFNKPNGNRLRWSYVWNLNHVPGRFEQVDYAQHQLKITLIFKR